MKTFEQWLAESIRYSAIEQKQIANFDAYRALQRYLVSHGNEKLIADDDVNYPGYTGYEIENACSQNASDTADYESPEWVASYLGTADNFNLKIINQPPLS